MAVVKATYLCVQYWSAVIYSAVVSVKFSELPSIQNYPDLPYPHFQPPLFLRMISKELREGVPKSAPIVCRIEFELGTCTHFVQSVRPDKWLLSMAPLIRSALWQ